MPAGRRPRLPLTCYFQASSWSWNGNQSSRPNIILPKVLSIRPFARWYLFTFNPREVWNNKSSNDSVYNWVQVMYSCNKEEKSDVTKIPIFEIYGMGWYIQKDQDEKSPLAKKSAYQWRLVGRYKYPFALMTPYKSSWNWLGSSHGHSCHL